MHYGRTISSRFYEPYHPNWVHWRHKELSGMKKEVDITENQCINTGGAGVYARCSSEPAPIRRGLKRIQLGAEHLVGIKTSEQAQIRRGLKHLHCATRLPE